jgi:hypothetical protein
MAGHYEADVNRGDLNMRSLTDELNDRHDKGWKLAHIFEQGGNTILIWEQISDGS